MTFLKKRKNIECGKIRVVLTFDNRDKSGHRLEKDIRLLV